MQDHCKAAQESPVQSNPASARDTDSNGLEDTKGELQHGCEHYRRRCKLVAPCCGEVFWCRHCHNDVKSENEVVRQSALSADTPTHQQHCSLMYRFVVQDPKKRHELERKNVKELVCALCGTRQPVNQHCQHCFVTFGVYSCMECIFFDDETAKKQFHCDDCGICRVGGREKFFHCQTCGCCYDKKLQVV